MAGETEVVIHFTKMVIEHSETLSKIAGGLIVLEILIIAHVLASAKVPFTKSSISWVLSVSMAASVVSVVFGYLGAGATVASLQNFVGGQTKVFVPSPAAEWCNLMQMLSLLVACGVFVFAFIFYSRVLAEQIIKAGGLKSGKGE
jgi:hypothetical protein